MESGENEPSEQTKELMTREFNLSKDWLEKGIGEPYIPQTRNQEILAFANQVMSDEDESFRKRLVHALSESPPEFWNELERIVNQLTKKD